MEAAGEWKGREGASNGGLAVGAAAVRGAAADVVGDGRSRERRVRGLAARVAGLVAAVIPGSAAPWIRARQSLATSAVSGDGRRHVRPLPRRHTWRGIDI